jgi:hypothetical protein
MGGDEFDWSHVDGWGKVKYWTRRASRARCLGRSATSVLQLLWRFTLFGELLAAQLWQGDCSLPPRGKRPSSGFNGRGRGERPSQGLRWCRST